MTKEFVSGLLERTPQVGLPVVLHFALEAPVHEVMTVLCALEDNGVLTIDQQDKLCVLAMRVSGSYERPENRCVKVLLRRHREQAKGLTGLAPHLDKIETQVQHQDLAGLKARQAKTRAAAADKIAETWVPRPIRELLRDWSLDLVHEVITSKPFPALEFRLQHGEVVISTYRIDVWSGLLCRNGSWQINSPVASNELTRVLRRDIDDYVETATRPVAATA